MKHTYLLSLFCFPDSNNLILKQIDFFQSLQTYLYLSSYNIGLFLADEAENKKVLGQLGTLPSLPLVMKHFLAAGNEPEVGI